MLLRGRTKIGESYAEAPIWMPVNAMIILTLLSYYLYYGDNFKIDVPQAPDG